MKKYICGIDENGFGPLLGPLVITGILTEEKVKIPEYIKDSKIIYKGRKDFEKLEEIAIATFYILENKFPKSPLEIIKKFSSLRCPFNENICEKNIPLKFKVKNQDKILFKYYDLIKERFKIKDLKVNMVCPYFFNEFLSKKKISKSILNLAKFCEIIKSFTVYKNTKFFCGKIGGMTYYKKYLQYYFPRCAIKVIEEKCDISEYKILNKNYFLEVSFCKNVENFSSLASFSSIIGKYIREIIMESIRKSLNISKYISGYRDKNTKKVVEKIDFSKFRKTCIIRDA